MPSRYAAGYAARRAMPPRYAAALCRVNHASQPTCQMASCRAGATLSRTNPPLCEIASTHASLTAMSDIVAVSNGPLRALANFYGYSSHEYLRCRNAGACEKIPSVWSSDEPALDRMKRVTGSGWIIKDQPQCRTKSGRKSVTGEPSRTLHHARAKKPLISSDRHPILFLP